MLEFHESRKGGMPSPVSRAWSIVISAGLFLLIAQWLRPLDEIPEITGLYDIRPILISIGFYLFVDALAIHPAAGWTLKTAASLALVGYLFGYQAWSGQSLNLYFEVLVRDVRHLLQGDLVDLSAENRTLMFMIGLALIVSVLHSLIELNQRVLGLVLLTVVYLLALQFWPGIDTGWEIVQTLAVGLIYLSLLNINRVKRKFSIARINRNWPILWIPGSLFVVSAALSLGMALADPHAGMPAPFQWTVSIPWLDRFTAVGSKLASLGADSFGSAPARTGYGNDDSRLGGSLVQDQGVAFIAKTDRLTYWRGEAKNIYDGRGWSEIRNDLYQGDMYSPFPSILGGGGEISANNGQQEKTINQEIVLNDKSLGNLFFSGGSIDSLQAVLSDRGAPVTAGKVWIDRVEGKYSLGSPGQALSYYKMKVSLPQSDPEVLKKDAGAYPRNIEINDLQLPEKLPERVVRLAKQITAGLDNNYDRAKAIEQYLRSHYSYNLRTSGYPAENEDFVDHFLFVEKQGYCDYFSTAMAVMLRAVHIPARWVKGFAPGEEINTDSSGEITVKVLNLHAHSWVEVYFPQSGWVPFDPTPGFSGFEGGSGLPVEAGMPAPASADQPGGTVLHTVQGSASLKDVNSAAAKLMERMFPAGMKQDPALKSTWPDMLGTVKQRIGGVWTEKMPSPAIYWIGLGVFLFGLPIWALRFVRRKRPAPFRQAAFQEYSLRVMERFWRKIFAKFGALGRNQTLREYVVSLKLSDGSKLEPLAEFVRLYEQARYGRPERGEFSEQVIRKLWQEIGK
ncbi:transglutaminase TgpA family protein [Ferviditalea candida]|uniref:Transglutaminase domain-containing protein n=1 Tax=Ferviditalea candida TaxID=3108399 RepID=A0ABU5ZQM0_9BACL|nr:transglutaminase domain-containing protein [Paenibacillaceae bacterium T2]